MPPGFSPGDARGEAPCIKITLVSPFPAGEGGRGDRGQKIKLKAGLAGKQESKPPAECRTGRSSQCRAPLSLGDARGEAPCIKITLVSPFPAGEGGRGDRGQKIKLKAGLAGKQESKPPAECRTGRSSQCRAPLSLGDARGEAPCIKITLVSPFPAGEGGRGDGGKKSS